MIIRNEIQSDVEVISDITQAAFEDHPYSRNTEHFIVNALRAADALAVSLVAEVDGKVVGHIALSGVTFSDGSENWYGLGPISVEPRCQRQGIGTRLVYEGLRLLRDMGAAGCVLVGEARFYERFGFRSSVGLRYEGVPQENLLVLCFGDIVPAGDVEFHEAFSATE